MSRLFKAVKRFAPKTKKLRIQLKDELGHLLAPSASAQAYRTFFSDLYQSPTVPPTPGFLTEDLDLSWAEWFSALAHTHTGSSTVLTYSRASLHLEPVFRLGLLCGRRLGRMPSWLSHPSRPKCPLTPRLCDPFRFLIHSPNPLVLFLPKGSALIHSSISPPCRNTLTWLRDLRPRLLARSCPTAIRFDSCCNLRS